MTALKNIFPHQSDVPRDRLIYLFEKLKKRSDKPEVDQLFDKLSSSIMAAMHENFKVDRSGKSWVMLGTSRVIGVNGIADLQKIMTQGFTAFENSFYTNYDQDVFEGFLHWNHLFFYKFYKFFFQKSEQNDGILVFENIPLKMIGRHQFALDHYVNQSIRESRQWLKSGRRYFDYDLKQ